MSGWSEITYIYVCQSNWENDEIIELNYLFWANRIYRNPKKRDKDDNKIDNNERNLKLYKHISFKIKNKIKDSLQVKGREGNWYSPSTLPKESKN